MESDILNHENITRLNIDGKDIILIGTAHVSQESVDLVEKVITEIKPDTIAVELCDSRYQSLKNPEKWKSLDLFTVIKEGKAFVLLSQLILSSFQKKIAKELKIQPGAEMMMGIKLAEEQNASLILADRDVKTTLKRTWANLSFWQGLKVMSALLAGLFTNEKVSAEDIEKLKKSDALEEAMKEFANQFPTVRESLIDERDKYLAEKIRRAEGNVIVAVLGAGHLPGIQNYIHRPRDLEPLEVIPPPAKYKKYISWGIPGIFVAIIAYLILSGETEQAKEFVYLWFIGLSAFATLGAIVVRSHPLTILSSAISAPFTFLHPVISVGMVAGLVEAYFRKPKVSDLETISEDITSWKGAINNQAVKIFLVLISTNLFTSLFVLGTASFKSIGIAFSYIKNIF